MGRRKNTSTYYQRNGDKFYFSVSFLVAVAMALGLGGCSKKEYFDPGHLPGGVALTARTFSGQQITIGTEAQDSLISSGTSYNLAGQMRDAEFGTTTAGFYAQLKLTGTNQNFGTNPHCDSIVLSLAYFDYYGDTTTPINFTVAKVIDELFPGTFYYSKTNFYTPDVVGQVFRAPRPKDSVTVAGTKTAPSLRFRLYDSFGQSILDANPSNFTNDAAFIAYLKGIYVTASGVGQDNKGSIMAFDLLHAQSKMTLYYGSGLAYDFIFNNTSARINKFDHSYTGKQIEKQLAGTSTDSSFLYLQGGGGLSGRIQFPGLASLSDSGRIIVNMAELVLSTSPGTPEHFLPPAKLSLARLDENGKNLVLSDQTEGAAYFGGGYSSQTLDYKFNLAHYVQEIVDRKFTDYGLRVLVSGSAVTPARLKLDAGAGSTRPIKLNISYTRY